MKIKTNFSLLTLFILIFISIFAFVPQSQAADQFVDINGHWAESAIQKMAEAGIASGFPDAAFRPDNKISRAEFAVLIVKAFDLESKNGKVFTDTSQHWAKDQIAAANTYGVVNGYNDSTFGPDDPITREQMALMIVKAAKLQISPGTLNCRDSAQVSSWAKDAVATAYAQKILSGMPDGNFKPQDHASRAQAIIVLSKTLELHDNSQPAANSPVKEAATISSITVKTAPKTVNYAVGETLDLNGLIVVLTKSDGSSEDVPWADFADNGITTSPKHGTVLSAADKAVIIMVKDKTVNQKITVANAIAGGGGGGGGAGSGGSGGDITPDPANSIAKPITFAESAIMGYVLEVTFVQGFDVENAVITYTNSTDPTKRAFFATTHEGGNVYRYLGDDIFGGDTVNFYVNNVLVQTINIIKSEI